METPALGTAGAPQGLFRIKKVVQSLGTTSLQRPLIYSSSRLWKVASAEATPNCRLFRF